MKFVLTRRQVKAKNTAPGQWRGCFIVAAYGWFNIKIWLLRRTSSGMRGEKLQSCVFSEPPETGVVPTTADCGTERDVDRHEGSVDRRCVSKLLTRFTTLFDAGDSIEDSQRCRHIGAGVQCTYGLLMTRWPPHGVCVLRTLVPFRETTYRFKPRYSSCPSSGKIIQIFWIFFFFFYFIFLIYYFGNSFKLICLGKK